MGPKSNNKRRKNGVRPKVNMFLVGFVFLGIFREFYISWCEMFHKMKYLHFKHDNKKRKKKEYDAKEHEIYWMRNNQNTFIYAQM